MVDNSKGADAEFASSLEASLRGSGFDVELRRPSPSAFYDTSIHFVVEGVAIRVLDEPEPPKLAAIARAVREAESSRRSERRRARAVPVYRGETSHVLTWVDVFDSDA